MSYDMDRAEMLGLIGPQNPKLTRELVRCKVEWQTLQDTYRANTRGRFLYQTTLGRIVEYVLSHIDHLHPQHQSSMARDITRWERECEHVTVPNKEVVQQNELVSSDDDVDMTSSSTSMSTHTTSTVLSIEQPPPHNPGLHMFLDYRDFHPFLRADTLDMTTSSSSSSTCIGGRVGPNQNAVVMQNRSLRNEIAKFQHSSKRLKIAILIEVQDLLKHQRTLRKVIDRIQLGDNNNNNSNNMTETSTTTTMTDSTMSSSSTTNSRYQKVVDTVLRWYRECQIEAEKCKSMSEDAAVEYIQCHSDDIDIDVITKDDDGSVADLKMMVSNSSRKLVTSTTAADVDIGMMPSPNASRKALGSSAVSPLVQSVVDDFTPLFMPVLPPPTLSSTEVTDPDEMNDRLGNGINFSTLNNKRGSVATKTDSNNNKNKKNLPLRPEQSNRMLSNKLGGRRIGSKSPPRRDKNNGPGCTVM